MSFYNTIEQEGFAEFKDRGSKFLGYSFPFDDVKQLKKSHPKAVHFCFAYKIGNNDDVFRSSDDGEPAGSAGKPILGQLHRKELTNVLVVIVRYFGGSLLGVPGLINAYKSTASMCLQVVPIVNKPILEIYTVQCDYTQMNDIMLIVNQFGCVVQAQENQLFCLLTIGIPIERKDNVLHLLKELRNVEFNQLL